LGAVARLRDRARGIPTAENATAIQSADLKPATNTSGELYTPGRLKTDARTAMPKTPPSSRSALFVPDAMPISSGATDAMTSFATAGNTIKVPTPPMVSKGAISRTRR
jgi:hypothetical protein